MNDFLKIYGQWGLVAGAAEGLGEAWCRTLANKKMNLVMVDFKEAELKSFSGKLEAEYHISTLAVAANLADPDAPSRILETVAGIDCRLMVYNAAYSIVQPFLKNTPEDLDHYVNVNMRSLIQLALPFGEKCVKEGGGGMIFMSSLAALWGTQLLAPYGATKAFDYILAEGLNRELKEFGVDVMACIAGATATPAYLATEPKYGWPRPSVMQPLEVTGSAIRKLGKRAIFIPGISNRFNHFILSRLLPRRLARGLFNSTTARMYRDRMH